MVWAIVHYMINLELPFTLYYEQVDVFLNREVFISYATERDIQIIITIKLFSYWIT